MSKYKTSVFCGAATAIITPFSCGEIDYGALGHLIDLQISNGIDALVLSGTTGEASTLSEKEFQNLISFSKERINNRVPLIVGSGSNDTSKAQRLTKAATDLGADACLVVTPYYNKATQKGLLESYKAIASSTHLPIIVYNVPTRTSMNISLKCYKELSKIDNIVAVKEAGPDITSCAELIFECGDSLDIYTGSDDQLLPCLALGGKGTISVVSNIIPREIHDICQNYFEGNIEESKKLFKKYYKLMRAMFYEVNPIPVKTALAAKGLCREEFRLPLCTISDENREVLYKIMKELDLI